MNPKTAILVLLTLLVGGCHSSPRRVDCTDHLTPINVPAPVDLAGEKRP
jgi:hypothetical protein